MPMTNQAARLQIILEASLVTKGMGALAGVESAFAGSQDRMAASSTRAAAAAEKGALRSQAAWDKAARTQTLAAERAEAAQLRYEQLKAKGAEDAAARAELAWTSANNRVIESNAKLAISYKAMEDAAARSNAAAAAASRARSSANTAGVYSAVGGGAIAGGAAVLGAALYTGDQAMRNAQFLNQIKANTVLTGAQIKQLSSLAWGIATKTGASFDDVMNAYRYGADVNLPYGLNKSTVNAAVQLALPTGAPLPDTMGALAVVGKNFTQWRSNPMAVANMLLQTSRYSRMNLSQLVTAIPQTLNVASHYGQQQQMLPQALAAVSSLVAANGGNADEANTQIYNLIARIANPSAAVKKSLATLQSQGYNLQGDFSFQGLNDKGLAGVITDLRNAHLNPSQLRTLFPYMRAYMGALSLTGNQYGSFMTDLGAIGGAPNQNPVGANYKSFLGLPSTAWGADLQTIQKDIVQIGQIGIPMLTEFLKDFQPLLKDFGSWVSDHKDFLSLLEKLAPYAIEFGIGLKAINVAVSAAAEVRMMAAAIGLVGKDAAISTELDATAASMTRVGVAADTAATGAEAASGKFLMAATSLRGIFSQLFLLQLLDQASGGTGNPVADAQNTLDSFQNPQPLGTGTSPLPAGTKYGVPAYPLFGMTQRPGDSGVSANTVSSTTSGIFDPASQTWHTGGEHYDIGTGGSGNQNFSLPVTYKKGGGENVYKVAFLDFRKAKLASERALGLAEVVKTPNGKEMLFAHLSKINPPSYYKPRAGADGIIIYEDPRDHWNMWHDYTGADQGPLGVTGNENGQNHLHVAADPGAMNWLQQNAPNYFNGTTTMPTAGSTYSGTTTQGNAGGPPGGPSGLPAGVRRDWPLVSAVSTVTGIPAGVLAAYMGVENATGRNSGPGTVSSAGAMGLMQVMPDSTLGGKPYPGWTHIRTINGVKYDLNDPRQNMLAGAALIQGGEAKYGNNWAAIYQNVYNPGIGGNSTTMQNLRSYLKLSGNSGGGSSGSGSGSGPTAIDPNAQLQGDQQGFNAVFGSLSFSQLSGPQRDLYKSFIYGIAQDTYAIEVATINQMTWMSKQQRDAALAAAKTQLGQAERGGMANAFYGALTTSESYDAQTIQTKWQGIDPTTLSGPQLQAYLHDMYRLNELNRQASDNQAKADYASGKITKKQMQARLGADNTAKNRANQQLRGQLNLGGPAGRTEAVHVTSHSAPTTHHPSSVLGRDLTGTHPHPRGGAHPKGSGGTTSVPHPHPHAAVSDAATLVARRTKDNTDALHQLSNEVINLRRELAAVRTGAGGPGHGAARKSHNAPYAREDVGLFA